MSRLLIVISIVVSISILGCGGDDGGTTTEPDPFPLVLDLLDGNNQIVAPGEPLVQPVRVRITRGGIPEAGVTMTWTTSEGSGPSESTTGSDGIATALWTLGAATNTRAATLTGTLGTQSVVFAAFVIPNSECTTAAGTVRRCAIQISGISFSPFLYRVQPGSKIYWVWGAGEIHNVVPDHGTEPPRTSDPVEGPHISVHTFNQFGTYRYHCEAHGEQGEVIVQVNP